MNTIKSIFLWLFCLSGAPVHADLTLPSRAAAAVSGAPRVQFIFREDYFITYVAVKGVASGPHAEDIVSLQNAMWELDRPAYDKLRLNRDIGPEGVEDREFQKLHRDFFSRVKKLPEYIRVKRQTLRYLRAAVREWERNLPVTTAFVRRYSGFDLSGSVKAYITHPALGNGRMQNREKKILSFGAWPTFDNYFSIYVWHEILHFYMPLNDLSHAVNQLLTDNDLRVRLNGSSLFPLQGHADLEPAMRALLPSWERYKENPTDLNDFVSRVSR